MNAAKEIVPSKFIQTYGIVLLVIGACCIMLPLFASVLIEWVISGTLIASGILFGVTGIHSRRWGSAIMLVLEALLFLCAGVYVLFNPLKAASFMMLVLAGFFLVGGLFRIMASMQMRYAVRGWYWMLISGIASVILGGLIWGMWPISSDVLFGTLFGINVIFAGWSMIRMGATVQQLTR
ncbi:MAG: DUF308 domain-containing protein [Kiritimatiellae bacterium]|nr:DUF308 domain-containing protein [Kiritimatiellia bacterium]MDD4736364.1 DUF308 domain-containing protein [Kiritimatiellia bacterium]